MVVEWQVRLIYSPHLLDQPLIYHLIQQFDLLTNILEAQVSSEQGWLILAMRGDLAKVEQGLTWIAQQGVQVEILAKVEEGT